MVIVISLLVIGFVAATVIGTQAYFRGEQSKPIHERNWNSEGFDRIAKAVTGKETDFSDRVPAYSGDAYRSSEING